MASPSGRALHRDQEICRRLGSFLRRQHAMFGRYAFSIFIQKVGLWCTDENQTAFNLFDDRVANMCAYIQQDFRQTEPDDTWMD